MDKNKNTHSYFETDSFRLEYKPEKKWIEGVWKDYANENEYKAILIKELTMIEKHNTDTLIIDAQNYKGTTDKMLNWLDHIWSKLAFKEGLKNFALIVTEDLYNKAHMHSAFEKNYYNFLNAKVFKARNEAEAWLCSIRSK